MRGAQQTINAIVAMRIEFSLCGLPGGRMYMFPCGYREVIGHILMVEPAEVILGMALHQPFTLAIEV